MKRLLLIVWALVRFGGGGGVAQFETENDCLKAMVQFNREERRRLRDSNDAWMAEFGRLLAAARCEPRRELSPRPPSPVPPAPTPPRQQPSETLTLTTAPRPPAA